MVAWADPVGNRYETRTWKQTMRILFAGNSLTQGSAGVSFVDFISKDHPDWTITNAGVNGDTLNNIHDRVKAELRASSRFDYVVIEAGHNDVLLPLFRSRGFLFRQTLKHFLKMGRKPLALPEFEKEYSEMIHLIQSSTQAKIVLTTLSCIGEQMNSAPNAQREQYNEAIRRLAVRHGCLLADTGNAFNDVLKTKTANAYLMDNFFNNIFLDSRYYRDSGKADALSHRRNLHLTTDGIHLNTIGARLFKEAVERTIQKDGC